MKSPAQRLKDLNAQYQKCVAALAGLGPICNGSAIKRNDVRQVDGQTKTRGPYYLWTRKLRAKTLSVALSEDQFVKLSAAIANHKKLEKTLAKMRQLAEKTIFVGTPGVKKRK
jgi:hypothetical protein